MPIFSYIGLAVASVGLVAGALLFATSFRAPSPFMQDMDFRLGGGLFFGSLLLGILCEISISLRRGRNG
jgi:hypothetical protein